MSTPALSWELIRAARERLAGRVHRTPVLTSARRIARAQDGFAHRLTELDGTDLGAQRAG